MLNRWKEGCFFDAIAKEEALLCPTLYPLIS